MAEQKTPLWCANDAPHDAHRERNEFNGWNECSGRPALTQTPEQIVAEALEAQRFVNAWPVSVSAVAALREAGYLTEMQSSFCGHEFPDEGDAIHAPGEPCDMICLASPIFSASAEAIPTIHEEGEADA